jgi:large subunit ribosomal protein L30
MRANLEALGLRHHQSVVLKTDSPALRGQLLRVRHLVKITSVTDTAATAAKAEKSETAAKAKPDKPAKTERKEKARVD